VEGSFAEEADTQAIAQGSRGEERVAVSDPYQCLRDRSSDATGTSCVLIGPASALPLLFRDVAPPNPQPTKISPSDSLPHLPIEHIFVLSSCISRRMMYDKISDLQLDAESTKTL
jgi:hypothetical protein